MSHGLPRGDGEGGVRALQALIDEVTLGIIRVSSDLTVRAANGAAHRLLERNARSLLGRSVMEAFVDHRAESTIRDAIGGTVGTLEFAVGRDRLLAMRARPDSEGGAWIAVEDV